MSTGPSFKIYALHILTMVSLVVAQPLLQQLTQNPTFFSTRGAGAKEILGFLAILCLLLPAPFLLVEWVLSFFSIKALRIVHHVFLFILFAIFSALVLKQLSFFSGILAILLSFSGSVLFVILYYRMSLFRTAITWLSPLIVAIPVFFALHGSVRNLIWTSNTPVPISSKTVSKTPVIMVTFDELPVTSLMNENLGIDSALFPNFASLLKDFTWYRNTTTVASTTGRAVPAILTGKYPDKDPNRAPTRFNHPQNLFTLFSDSHELKVFETITSLCPEKLNKIAATSRGKSSVLLSTCLDALAIYLQIVVPPPYSASLPDVSSTWGDFWDAGERNPHRPAVDKGKMFETFIQSIVPSEKPLLAYLHIGLPHRPWKYLPNGQQYFDFGEGRKNDEFWEENDWAAVTVYQRHLLQLGYADKLLGELIHRLKQIGIYNSALIVLTSDHGISLWPGEFKARNVTTSTYQDVLLVPFFIKEPGQESGSINDRKLETVDILPTMANLMDVEVPWKTDGVSALRSNLPERKHRKVFLNDAIVSNLTCDIQEENKTLKRKTQIFGKATKFADIFQIGSFPHLFNKTIDELPVSPGDDFRVRIRAKDLFDNVDPHAAAIPSYVSGKIRSPGSKDLVLAIVANGKISAVTRTFTTDGVMRFGALIPPSHLVKGKNKIEVLVIPDQEGDRFLLASIRGE